MSDRSFGLDIYNPSSSSSFSFQPTIDNPSSFVSFDPQPQSQQSYQQAYQPPSQPTIQQYQPSSQSSSQPTIQQYQPPSQSSYQPPSQPSYQPPITSTTNPSFFVPFNSQSTLPSQTHNASQYQPMIQSHQQVYQEPTHQTLMLEDYQILELEKKQYEDLMAISQTVLIVIVFIVLFFFICYIIWISTINTTTGTTSKKVSYNTKSTYPIDRNYGGNSYIPYNYMNGKDLKNKNECLPNKWNSKLNICECRDQYFGPMCNVEIHDIKYNKLNLNTPYVDFKTSQIIKNVDYLSFNIDGSKTNTCTNYCDNISECKGVKFENNECSIITSPVTIKTNVINNPYIGDLYIKTPPLLENKVLIFKNSIPKGYFYDRNNIIPKNQNDNGLMEITLNKITISSFLPDTIINDNNLIGIWSIKPFDEKDFNKMLDSNSATIYIDRGSKIHGYKINFSNEFKNNKKFYIYYKSNILTSLPYKVSYNTKNKINKNKINNKKKYKSANIFNFFKYIL